MSTAMATAAESYTFTVGKLDAGMAILLGDRAHLIEFPSILLPPGATAGSIVNIAVHQNHAAEEKRDKEFWELQQEIMEEFGVSTPVGPELKLRNVTQTAVTLEWPAISLATSKLRSLDIFRNSQRLAAIPSPMTNTSTKVSGLELNTDYTFQLILRTTAGTFPSNVIKIRTHTMNDTSGICVCFGNVGSGPNAEIMLDNTKLALEEMGAKWSDKIEIDTTHFVCTTPAASGQDPGTGSGAPGVLYQRALQLSIPVIQPEWILACHSEKRMVPVAPYYLGATPATTTSFRPQSMSATTGSSAMQQQQREQHRQSMPPRSAPVDRGTPPGSSTFVNNIPARVEEEDAEDESAQRSSEKGKGRAADPPSPPTPSKNRTPPLEGSDNGHGSGGDDPSTDKAKKRKSRTGTMNREFKFPTPVSSPVVSSYEPASLSIVRSTSSGLAQSDSVDDDDGHDSGKGKGKEKADVVLPIEVPPPPPVEKERRRSAISGFVDDDDLGDTEEISLN